MQDVQAPLEAAVGAAHALSRFLFVCIQNDLFSDDELKKIPSRALVDDDSRTTVATTATAAQSMCVLFLVQDLLDGEYGGGKRAHVQEGARTSAP